MLNSFNHSNNIQSKNSKSKNKKYSISIYSNPYNINFPFETNKINQNGVSTMYKMTSDKIQNLNPNTTKEKNKITISNLLSMLHSTDSQLNQPINLSLRNNFQCKNSTMKIKFPAKNSIREESHKHTKAISFNYNKKDISKEKTLKDKIINHNIKLDILKIKRKIMNLSHGKKNKKVKNIKKENSKNINEKNIYSNNNNKLIVKKENSFHQRKPSITYRNLSNKKKCVQKINRIPINKIINKLKNNSNNRQSKSNLKLQKIPLRKNSNSKDKKDLSIGKISNVKNTENTQYTTFKRDSIYSKNLFENLDNSTEGNEFDKLQNDLESLVRKINFDNIKDNLNIFSSDNGSYLSYKKNFNFIFDNEFDDDDI